MSCRSQESWHNINPNNKPEGNYRKRLAMMVKDHTAANQKPRALAATKGVKLPGRASVAQKAK